MSSRFPDVRLRRTFVALVAGAALLAPAQALAQVQPPPPVLPVTGVVPAVGAHVSPRGAFLRALLVPGWGHASIGAYRRGAFYVTVESATGWALFKAIQRVREAETRVRFRETLLRGELSAQGVTDPEEIQTALDGDETLQDLMALDTARRQQREDWTSLGIFLVFLSGADAYVSAHLRHFPAPIQINATPAGNGRMELSVGITPPR